MEKERLDLVILILEKRSWMESAINSITGLVATVGIDVVTKKNILTVFQDSSSLTITGTYTGIASITASGLIGDPVFLMLH